MTAIFDKGRKCKVTIETEDGRIFKSDPCEIVGYVYEPHYEGEEVIWYLEIKGKSFWPTWMAKESNE